MRNGRILFLILGLVGMGIMGFQKEKQPLSLTHSNTKAVEVKGAVLQPGVYELPWDATVAEAIQAARGIHCEADLSAVNQTRNLESGEVLVIPEKQEEVCISINTASAEQLDALPGIGMKMAERIIAERTKNPFTQPEDIKRVKGIGDKMYEKMADQICL